MKTGIELITEERKRQIEVEGWTLADDMVNNTAGELANAAACYAMTEDNRLIGDDDVFAYLWSWEMKYWKPTPNDRIRELVRAGALIAAEIDRLTELNK